MELKPFNQAEYIKEWRLKNKEKVRKYKSEWGKKNPDKINKYNKKWREDKKWFTTFYSIKTRCEKPSCQKYMRYGGRGIKCLITAQQVKELWYRDKAYLMKKPSIDKIDNDGNYTIENCRFIELAENVRKGTSKCV